MKEIKKNCYSCINFTYQCEMDIDKNSKETIKNFDYDEEKKCCILRDSLLNRIFWGLILTAFICLSALAVKNFVEYLTK